MRLVILVSVCLVGCKPQNKLSDSFLRLVGYRLLVVSAASKTRHIHLSLLGFQSSVSITRSNSTWLYSPVVYASTPPENSNPQTSPARHKVHQKVPMQLTFLTLSPEGQASPALAPFGQRVVSETASLRTHFLLNLSFLLTPTQTQTAGSFPFLSPHY